MIKCAVLWDDYKSSCARSIYTLQTQTLFLARARIRRVWNIRRCKQYTPHVLYTFSRSWLGTGRKSTKLGWNQGCKFFLYEKCENRVCTCRLYARIHKRIGVGCFFMIVQTQIMTHAWFIQIPAWCLKYHHRLIAL